MRYVLLDNAIIQCNKITAYAILDTSELFIGKEYYGLEEYTSVFNSIKSFLSDNEKTHELFVCTHFYFVPCFISELSKYLGSNVKITPIYSITDNNNLNEIYDKYSIRTINDKGLYKCSILKNDVMEQKGRGIEKFFSNDRLGISTIININQTINSAEEELTLDNFNDYFVGDESYINLIKCEEGYYNFSPFCSLKFYDIIAPSLNGFDTIMNTSTNNEDHKHNYVLFTYSGDHSFVNSYKTWIIIEKNSSFLVKIISGNIIKENILTIPQSLIEESEISIDNLHFGKFFVDINSDFLGNLHIIMESLSGKTFFQTIKFAL